MLPSLSPEQWRIQGVRVTPTGSKDRGCTYMKMQNSLDLCDFGVRQFNVHQRSMASQQRSLDLCDPTTEVEINVDRD